MLGEREGLERGLPSCSMILVTAVGTSVIAEDGPIGCWNTCMKCLPGMILSSARNLVKRFCCCGDRGLGEEPAGVVVVDASALWWSYTAANLQCR